MKCNNSSFIRYKFQYLTFMKNLLLISILLSATFSYAQNKNQFSFSGGLSLPMGKFKAKDLNKSDNGFAETGYNLQLNYSRAIAKQFDLQLTLMGITNGTDNEPVIRDFINKYPSTERVKIRGRAWNSTSLLLGISKMYQLANINIILTPIIKMGTTYAIRPELFISTNRNDFTIPQSESISEAFSFSFLLGLNNSYEINEAISIISSVEYFLTAPEFEYIRYSESNINLPSTKEEVKVKQDMQLLLINAGIRLSI